MKITSTYKIGTDTITFEADGADVKEQFMQLSNIKPRLYCDVCKNTDPSYFRLFCNEKDGITYVKLICYGEKGSCKSQSSLGTFKNNKGYFWRKFEKYIPSAQEGGDSK